MIKVAQGGCRWVGGMLKYYLYLIIKICQQTNRRVFDYILVHQVLVICHMFIMNFSIVYRIFFLLL